MAEIAAREAVSELRALKSASALIACRAFEAADTLIAVQVNRLYQALRTPYGAMSARTLATVDRVVRIARELGRHCGVGGVGRNRKAVQTLEKYRFGSRNGAGRFSPCRRGSGRGGGGGRRPAPGLPPPCRPVCAGEGGRNRKAAQRPEDSRFGSRNGAGRVSACGRGARRGEGGGGRREYEGPRRAAALQT